MFGNHKQHKMQLNFEKYEPGNLKIGSVAVLETTSKLIVFNQGYSRYENQQGEITIGYCFSGQSSSSFRVRLIAEIESEKAIRRIYGIAKDRFIQRLKSDELIKSTKILREKYFSNMDELLDALVQGWNQCSWYSEQTQFRYL